jgi:hypothetical protein
VQAIDQGREALGDAVDELRARVTAVIHGQPRPL